MDRLARCIEGIDAKPAIIDRIARRPDDRLDPRFREIKRFGRVGDTLCIRSAPPLFRVFGQIKPIARHISISLIEQAQMVRIAIGNIARKVTGKT